MPGLCNAICSADWPVGSGADFAVSRMPASADIDLRPRPAMSSLDEFLSPGARIFAPSLFRNGSNGGWCSRPRSPALARVTRPRSTNLLDVLLLTPMFATVFGAITAPRRAGALALLWLLVITILNVQTSGAFRSTVLFAVPVAVVACSSLRLGAVFSGLALGSAIYGGAMPAPGSADPWTHGACFLVGLCTLAVAANAYGRRRGCRVERGSEPQGPVDEAKH